MTADPKNQKDGYNTFIKGHGVGEKVLNIGTRTQSSQKKYE